MRRLPVAEERDNAREDQRRERREQRRAARERKHQALKPTPKTASRS